MFLRLLLFLLFAIFLDLAKSAERECVDELPECASLLIYCDDPKYKQYARTNCPVTCERCPRHIDPNGLCRNNGGCQHECTVENKIEKKCICYKNYVLTANGLNCTDVDECTRPNICGSGKVCRNLDGSFICEAVKCRQKGLDTYKGRPDCCKKAPENSRCGVAAEKLERIVGGNNSYLGQWPWQTFVLTDKSVVCGGSLLNDRWVVTAGHCFRGYNSRTVHDIYFGVVELSKLRQKHVQHRKPKRHILYPTWKSSRFENNDIALIELEKPVILNDVVKPICLPNGEKARVGVRCFAAGWGLRDQLGSSPSEVLQHVDLPIVDPVKCTQSYRNQNNKVNSTIMICAGYDEGGKDACRGDSGGPLICQRCDSCEWYLAGVTSFGKGCARKGFYGVYTNVVYFEDWISSITGVSINTKRSCEAPYWSAWSAWASCSISCGSGGRRSRTRVCNNQREDGSGCSGSTSETKNCPPKACPRFGNFGKWSVCSKTCEEGQRTRIRACTNGKLGDDGCPNSGATQSENCNTLSCPVWSNWSPFTKCSTTCGAGKKSRTRTCTRGKVGDVGCEGKVTEDENCNLKNCPGWSDWDSWGTCSVKCGGGTQSSSRTCVGTGCLGESTRTQECNRQACPTLGNWGQWSSCPVSCGGGMISRTKECKNGQIGQDGCEADNAKEEKTCNERSCPTLSGWTKWNDCTVSCGGGERSRTRECRNTDIPTECGEQLHEKEKCNEMICPGKWAEWTKWSKCDAECGSGSRRRTRDCKGGEVGKPGCDDGLAQETMACQLDPCSSQWNQWERWADCSQTCASGVRTRTRTCSIGKAGEGGCIPASAASEDMECNARPCQPCEDIQRAYCDNVFPFPNYCDDPSREFIAKTYCPKLCNLCRGLHGAWQAWGPCTSTCGPGNQRRIRECENVKAGCDGEPSQRRKCEASCRGFSQWAQWSPCSASCNGGSRTRTRTCPFDTCNPDQDGSSALSETGTCQTNACPGVWKEWTNWGKCSETCGQKGMEARTRVCEGGVAGGPGCSGQATRTRPCSDTTRCPGRWSDWTQWSVCSVNCGGGERRRSRTCVDGGKNRFGCEGETSEIETCGMGKCVAKWGKWDEWSDCNKECKRERKRKCSGGVVGDIGCDGSTSQSEDCPPGDCGSSSKKHCEGITDRNPFFCPSMQVSDCETTNVFNICSYSCCMILPCSNRETYCEQYKSLCNNPAYNLLKVTCPLSCGLCKA